MKLSTLTLAVTLLAPVALHAQSAEPGTKPEMAAMPEKKPAPPSHQLTIVFQGRTTVLAVEDLMKLPQVTVHVHNAHRNTDEDYGGPLLADVLAKAGLSPSHENEQTILHSAIVATATDNYFVLYSCAEVEPAFSNSKVIVALTKGNGLPNTEGGNIQLVNTDGAKPARWVHGLTTLNVIAMQQSK